MRSVKAAGKERAERRADAREQEAAAGRGGRARAWVLVGAAVGVGLGGLALVLSAPLNGSARTGLGSGLITGLIVGVAVAAIQWTVESRRVARELEEKERQHRTMYEVARSRLG